MQKTNNQMCEYGLASNQSNNPQFPQQLDYLSDKDIEIRLKRLVQMEREVLHEVLVHIHEVYSRKIYLKRARSSLFDYLTRDMGYSAAAAQRRIDAARLCTELPEVLSGVKEGSLNLSQISLLAKACREREKQNKIFIQQNQNPSLLDFASKPTVAKATANTSTADTHVDFSLKPTPSQVSTEEKQKILKELSNKSQKETEQIVLQAFNLPKIKQTKIRHQSDGSVCLEMPLSQDQWHLLKRCQELLAHKNPHGEWSEVLKLVCDFYISKKDLSQSHKLKNRKTLSGNQQDLSENKSFNRRDSCETTSNSTTSAAEVDGVKFVPASMSQKNQVLFGARSKKRQALSISVRRMIFQRDRCCQFKDPSTGKICGSRYQLEIDHKIPVAHGGSNDPSNLRLTCRAHNQWLAVEKIGVRNIRSTKSI